MKTIRNLYLALVAVTVILSSGCLTKRQVQNIVTASNAAMIPQDLLAPGSASTNSWATPLAQINQLLVTLTNSSSLVLSNQLALRAAVLLTVNNQGSLATPYWDSIDPSKLVTARDLALYENHETLVWWYNRAPSAAPLAGPELTQLLSGLTNATTTIGRLTNTADADIKIYLGTIRAQMALKYFNDQPVNNTNEQNSVAHGLALNLGQYVDVFAASDVSWVRSNKTTALPPSAAVASIRNRVWLREMIGEYQTTALNQGVTPIWTPVWIAGY